jgi:hypothetical protein
MVEPVSVVTAVRVFAGVVRGLGFLGGFGSGWNQGPPILTIGEYLRRARIRLGATQGAVDVGATPGVDITPRYNPNTNTIDYSVGDRRTLPGRPPPSADKVEYRRKGPRKRLRGRRRLNVPTGPAGVLMGTAPWLISETAYDDVVSKAEMERRFRRVQPVTWSNVSAAVPLEPVVVKAKRLPEPAGLSPVKVTARRLPRPPLPSAAPKTAVRSPTRSSLLLPYLYPASQLLAPLLFGQSRPRDRLTVVDVPGVGSQPQPEPAGAGLLGGGSFISSSSCECPPKRKGKKRRRTVCYSGTYVERSSGLSKTKRRKIPCK